MLVAEEGSSEEASKSAQGSPSPCSSERETLAQIGGRVGGSWGQDPDVEIVNAPVVGSVLTSGSSLAATIFKDGIDPGGK